MAKDNKNVFEGDMFADDNDKWSLPVGGTAPKIVSGESNYEAYPVGSRPDSSDSEDGFVMHGDSNSQQRSLEVLSSSSKSVENNETSPRRDTCERVLPSIYDDDARSGSPGNVQYEDKNLAFDSFKKSLGSKTETSPPKEQENAECGLKKIDYTVAERNRQKRSYSKERRERSDSRERKEGSRERRGRSGSRGKRERSGSREGRPRKISPEHKSRERHSFSGERKYRRSQSRSHSRERRPRYERRPSRDGYDNRYRGQYRRGRPGRGYRRRSRSRSYERRRRSRSRSYDRYRRSKDHYRRRSSRSRSRDRSKGGANCRKLSALCGTSASASMTPQMALQQTMAAMSAKAEALTGIALPKYYNPAAVNPLKYAEQVQKRKLLWQPKEKEEDPLKGGVWNKMTFAQDQDGKMTAKFRKLMGIKSDGPSEVEEKEESLKKQEVLFRDLDQQYETARMTTHTQRGVGLGYSQQPIYPAASK